MDYYELLDYLGSLSEEDRLVEIEKYAEIIYSDEFIDLIKGQLQFAAKEMAGSGYFNKIFVGENDKMLSSLQSDYREKDKKNKKVWHSMINIDKGFNFRNIDQNSLSQQSTNQDDDENIFNYDFCLKCGLPGGSTALCDKCIIEE